MPLLPPPDALTAALSPLLALDAARPSPSHSLPGLAAGQRRRSSSRRSTVPSADTVAVLLEFQGYDRVNRACLYAAAELGGVTYRVGDHVTLVHEGDQSTLWVVVCEGFYAMADNVPMFHGRWYFSHGDVVAHAGSDVRIGKGKLSLQYEMFSTDARERNPVAVIQKHIAILNHATFLQLNRWNPEACRETVFCHRHYSTEKAAVTPLTACAFPGDPLPPYVIEMQADAVRAKACEEARAFAIICAPSAACSGARVSTRSCTTSVEPARKLRVSRVASPPSSPLPARRTSKRYINYAEMQCSRCDASDDDEEDALNANETDVYMFNSDGDDMDNGHETEEREGEPDEKEEEEMSGAEEHEETYRAAKLLRGTLGVPFIGPGVPFYASPTSIRCKEIVVSNSSSKRRREIANVGTDVAACTSASTLLSASDVPSISRDNFVVQATQSSNVPGETLLVQAEKDVNLENKP
jgi:DNA-directed RNA polymerase subunit M/transcription elongation factor TFIIS